MIGETAFAEGMARLTGALKMGEVDPPVAAMYYRILSPLLTDEEWLRAVDLTAATERYWPSPAVILEKIRPAGEVAFQVVNDAFKRHGGHMFLPAEVSMGWDRAIWAGIKAVGGLAAITSCEGEKKWDALKRKFAVAHTNALLPQKQLPKDTPQPRVMALVNRTVKQLSRGKDAAIPTGDQ